jgi:N-acetyl-alpha-D-glucosaminyl L-malate synthase BshA
VSASPAPSRSLSIGVTCYPTFGGSGIIATEIGLELARRGHAVHFICTAAPWRFDRAAENVFLHVVEVSNYPLFGDGQYALALASKMVEVAQKIRLDLFHVHYAILHATAAYLARQILGPTAPKLVTTLHGTDITVVGQTPSFLPVTRFSIQQSDAVTVPSRYLRGATQELLGPGPQPELQVIPNFVDTALYQPGPREARPLRVVHNSNFRPLKRVGDVIRIFAEVRRKRECELVLIGDGPDRAEAEKQVRELGLQESVSFLGQKLQVSEVLQSARVFLLPSAAEAFGLAALEAMSCGVPVVASNLGGLPEVVEDGASGFLRPLGDIEGMAEAVGRLIDDEALHQKMSSRSRAIALEKFQKGPIVDAYLASYIRVLSPR